MLPVVGLAPDVAVRSDPLGLVDPTVGAHHRVAVVTEGRRHPVDVGLPDVLGNEDVLEELVAVGAPVQGARHRPAGTPVRRGMRAPTPAPSHRPHPASSPPRPPGHRSTIPPTRPVPRPHRSSVRRVASAPDATLRLEPSWFTLGKTPDRNRAAPRPLKETQCNSTSTCRGSPGQADRRRWAPP